MNKSRGARQLCLDLLRRSPCRVQMAAVVVDRRGHIVSWGWNHGHTHAEEHTFVRANPKRLPGAVLVVAGQRARSGNAVYARPCRKPGKDCWAQAKARGLAAVIFRDKEGRWIEEVL